MANTEIIRDYTTGSIPKNLWRFAVPFMLSNALQVAYSLVDMIVVGRIVGSYGLSGVTVGSSIVMFMTMIGLGFSNGGQIYIAQLIGAGRKKDLNSAIGTLFTLVIGMSLVLTVVGLLDGVVLRICLSYLFGIVLDMGLYGFFLGYGLAAYGTSIPGTIYYLSGK